ncbi:hypothetical protein ACLOJK_032442 [Asimina triloba]
MGKRQLPIEEETTADREETTTRGKGVRERDKSRERTTDQRRDDFGREGDERGGSRESFGDDTKHLAMVRKETVVWAMARGVDREEREKACTSTKATCALSKAATMGWVEH